MKFIISSVSKLLVATAAFFIGVAGAFAQSAAYLPHPSCANPNCSAVCEAARAQVLNDVAAATTRAIEVTEKVGKAKSCVQNIVGQVNRQIPSFGGGGVIDQIASSLLNLAADKACNVMESSSRAVAEFGGAAPVLQEVRAVVSQPAAAAPAAQPGLMSRFLNIF